MPDKPITTTKVVRRPTVPAQPKEPLPKEEKGGRPKLYPFQVRGVQFLRNRQSALLADDMGLGKTAQTLCAMGTAAVVACPAVVKTNWEDECDLSAPRTAPHGAVRPRQFPLAARGRSGDHQPRHLPNAAQLKRLGDPPERMTLVADECHSYKNHKTQQTQRWRAMRRKVLRVAGQTWGLSGTPLKNRPKDLWGTLQSFGLGKASFGNWFQFVRCFNGKKKHWGGHEWRTLSDRQKAEIGQRLRNVMLRRLKYDVLDDLPPRMPPKKVRVKITGEAVRACDAVAKALQAVGVDLETATAAVLRSALKGAAFEELSRARMALAAAKYPYAAELLDLYEEQDVPVLLFSAHKSPVDAAGARPGWFKIHGDTSADERGAIKKRFQAGEGRGVAMGILSAGVGLTLHRASNGVFVDRAWAPTENEQAICRMERIGQKSSVQVTDVVAQHPLEARLWQLLAEKDDWLDAVDHAVEGGDE